MRSSILVAAVALAGSAIATPIDADKRQVIVTKVVQVSAPVKTVWVQGGQVQTQQKGGQQPQNPPPAAPKPQTQPQPQNQPQTQPQTTSNNNNNNNQQQPATGGTDYKSKVLNSHNGYRAKHSASPLTWNSTLEAVAQGIANKCVFAHDMNEGGGGYGQNLALGISADSIDSAMTMFYNEESKFAPYYGQANPSMSTFESWGHFTQLVWKNTKEVACATAACGGGSKALTVCNYTPPGNYGGQYAANVAAN